MAFETRALRVATFRAFFPREGCLLRLRRQSTRRQCPPLAAAALILAACAGEVPRAPTGATDDFGDPVAAQAPFPRRVVSLNPATTELLFALGAGSRLVGRTSWDVWPDSARIATDVGAGLQPNVEAILALRPDLAILYASGDNRAAATRLQAAGVRTLSLKTDRIADFFRAARLMGAVLGDSARGAVVADSVARTLQRVRSATARFPKPTVVWPFSESPVIVAGAGSYINELLVIAGAQNVYAGLAAPSPTVTMEDVLRRAPNVVLASPDAARAITRDPGWRSLDAVRTGRVLVYDTTLVNRPSVTLGAAAVSLARLLHPGAMQPGDGR